MKRIIIPKVDVNIEEGSLGAWMAAPGDKVSKGQLLVEYITDKAVFEIEAPAGGILRHIAAPEKSVVPIGAVIGLIGRPDEPLPDIEAENRRLVKKHRADLASGSATPAEASHDKAPGRRPRATMAARRLARRKGIALEAIQAQTGDQLITEEMVEAAARELS